MITVDTSAALSLVEQREPNYTRTKAALDADPGPYLIPVGILSELTYLLYERHGQRVLESFLGDVEAGAYTLDCGDNDLPRIRYLVHRYANLPLGYADAAVIACAERSGGRILSLDVRDFRVVAGEGRITVLPE